MSILLYTDYNSTYILSSSEYVTIVEFLTGNDKLSLPVKTFNKPGFGVNITTTAMTIIQPIFYLPMSMYS